MFRLFRVFFIEICSGNLGGNGCVLFRKTLYSPMCFDEVLIGRGSLGRGMDPQRGRFPLSIGKI